MTEAAAEPPFAGSRQCPQCGAVYPHNERFCTNDGASLVQSTAPTELVGSILGGKYLVEGLIGAGGMGVVFRARHIQLDQVRAIKRMHHATLGSATTLERFRREARQQGRIRHPNVAIVYDFEEAPDGSCFLVMEYVDGRSLGDLLRGDSPLPLARIAGIVTQVATGLDAAHEAGVVHRDLKPDNILIATGRDGSDCIKVVDFGIATLIDEPLASARITNTGFVIGTPRYMSPEQLLPTPGRTVDGRSDVYALGLLTMEMLVGDVASGGWDLGDVMQRATSAPPSVSRLRTDIDLPETLDAVFERALAVDRNARYATAGAFARDLVTALAGTGVAQAALPSPGPTPHNAEYNSSSAPTAALPVTPTHTPDEIAAPATATPAARRWSIPLWLRPLIVIAFIQWWAWHDLPAGKAISDNIRGLWHNVTGATKLTDTSGTRKMDSMNAASDTTGSGVTGRNSSRKTSISGRDNRNANMAAVLRLRAVERLPVPDNAEKAVRRIREVDSLLRYLHVPADSVSAQLIIIAALAVTRETARGCDRIELLRRMPLGPRQAEAVAVLADSMACR